MTTIQIKKDGRRFYATNAPYALKDQLKSIGFKFDPQNRQWYTGKKERADQAAQLIIAENNDDRSVNVEDKIIQGRVEYTSKAGKTSSYYICGRSERTAKYKLTILSGEFSFWAAYNDCGIPKFYNENRTLRGIKSWIDAKRQQEAKAQAISADGEVVTKKRPCSCMRGCKCAVSGYCPTHHDGCDKCGMDRG